MRKLYGLYSPILYHPGFFLTFLLKVYGHVHSSLRILVNISGPIKRHGVVNFVTL